MYKNSVHFLVLRHLAYNKDMSLFEAIVLGLIQGLTEFIPISSSGHLVLAQHFFGHESDHLFLEFINIGTVLALIVYFWPRLIKISKDIFVDHNWRMARNVIITAVPAGLLGLIFADVIETHPFFSNGWVVVVMLALLGVVMVLLPKLPKLSLVKRAEDLNIPRALAIGLTQALALIPGTSRSGSTIIAGRLLGLRAAEAAEYSFLVSIPIMLGVTAKVLVSDQSYLIQNLSMLTVSNSMAFISGFIAVRFLMRYLEKHELAVFGWYRIVLAGVIATIFLIQ